MAVVGQAMCLRLKLFSGASPPRINPELEAAVAKLVAQGETQTNLAPSERQHVQAVKLLADGSGVFFFFV